MHAQALAFLSRDPVAYMDMLTPLRRGSGQVIAAGPGGVVLWEHIGQLYMVATADDAPAPALPDAIPAPALMSIHGGAAARAAARRFGLTVMLTCHQAVWTGNRPPQIPASPFQVRPLDAGFAGVVSGLYSHDIGLPYIQARLSRGELWGAFDGGTLAGFMGLHAEGSMGMLEVVPAYRRRGVGRRLAAFVMGVVMAGGGTPFSQFTVDNTASRALNEALGMTLSQETIYWLEQP